MRKLSEFDFSGPRDFILVRGTEFENFGPNCPKMALFGPKMDLGKNWGPKWPETPQKRAKIGAFFWACLGGKGVPCQPLCSGPNLALAFGPNWPKTAKKVWQPCIRAERGTPSPPNRPKNAPSF